MEWRHDSRPTSLALGLRVASTGTAVLGERKNKKLRYTGISIYGPGRFSFRNIIRFLS